MDGWHSSIHPWSLRQWSKIIHHHQHHRHTNSDWTLCEHGPVICIQEIKQLVSSGIFLSRQWVFNNSSRVPAPIIHRSKTVRRHLNVCNSQPTLQVFDYRTADVDAGWNTAGTVPGSVALDCWTGLSIHFVSTACHGFMWVSTSASSRPIRANSSTCLDTCEVSQSIVRIEQCCSSSGEHLHHQHQV